jgi:hypothetical protein
MTSASVLITWLLIAAPIPAADQAAQTQQNAQNPQLRLFLNSEGGLSPYRRCSVEVNLIETRGVTELSCDVHIAGGAAPPLTARLELSTEEIARMRSLFSAAELYDGRHIGCVARGEDIPWLTLLAMSPRGDVVLLPECNRSFQDDPARRDLLKMMGDIGARLFKAAEEARRAK